MYAHVTNEFRSQRSRPLAEQVRRFRNDPIRTLREVAVASADGIKSLKAPVRAFGHSGVKLTAVSQIAVRDLIELESDVITSALTAAAMRLERAAQAEGVADLILDQAEMLGATRDRIVSHAARAVEVLKATRRDLRGVARHAYEIAAKATDEPTPKAGRAKRKGKRAVRKTAARARRAAA